MCCCPLVNTSPYHWTQPISLCKAQSGEYSFQLSLWYLGTYGDGDLMKKSYCIEESLVRMEKYMYK